MELLDINLDKIQINNYLKDRDVEGIEESSSFLALVSSIKRKGLISPIVVYPSAEKDKFIIEVGKRRYLAYQVLYKLDNKEFSSIPCIIKKNTDVTIQLHENMLREGISTLAYMDSIVLGVSKIIHPNEKLSLLLSIKILQRYLDFQKGIVPPNSDFHTENNMSNTLQTYFNDLGVSDKIFSDYLLTLKCSKLAKELYFKQKLFLSDTIFYSSLSKDIQIEMYNDILISKNKTHASKIVKKNSFSVLNGNEEIKKFLSLRIRKIKRIFNDVDSLTDKEGASIKEHLLKIEAIVENKKKGKK